MKISTRLISLILAAVFALTLLCGCNIDNADANQTDADVTTVDGNGNDGTTTAEETEPPEQAIEIDAGNIGDYSVVRAEKASKTVLTAAADFRTKLSDSLGVQVMIAEDWIRDPSTIPEKAKEIVVGPSNRPDSKGIEKELGEKDFAIVFKNDRIYIIGGSDASTVEALDYFNEHYVDSQSKKISVTDRLADYHRYDYPIKSVSIDGINIRDYTVVIPDDATLYEQYAAENLSNYLFANAGFGLEIVTDKAAETDNEILIGDTNRAASKVNVTTGDGQYILLKTGSKVVCLGESYMVGGGIGEITMKLPADSKGKDYNITDLQTTASAKTFTFKEAKSAILMIGDGMGFNTIAASLGTIGSFSGADLPNHGESVTSSLNTLANSDKPTDSAAGATALACGFRTYNSYLGFDGSKRTIQNIRELAYSKGARTGVITTDVITGATPAGFLVHHSSRSDTTIIQNQITNLMNAQKVDWCVGSLTDDLQDNTADALNNLSRGGSSFFLMVEAAQIDKNAHKTKMEDVIDTVARFNDVIAYVTEFVICHPDTVLIVTADHETGGITPATSISDVSDLIKDNYEKIYKTSIEANIANYGYSFTSYYNDNSSSPCEHTTANVPIFAIGNGTEYFNGKTVNNVDIPKFMAKIFGNNSFGQ